MVSNFKKIGLNILLIIVFASCKSTPSTTTEREQDFNFNWKFKLSNDSISGVEAITFDDENWRSLNLPHDWAVENEFDETLGEDARGTGYLASKGYGYYRKSFDKPFNENKTTYILFDGVYNNSEVYINGSKLGFHPYGYSPFYFDISPYLNKTGTKNNITVKIDHTRFADSRWYTGAGIYRNVQLISTNNLHIPV